MKNNKLSTDSQKLNFLTEFSKTLVSCENLNEIYEIICHNIRLQMKCRTAALFLLNVDGSIQRKFISGLEKSAPSIEVYKIGQGYIGRSVKNKKVQSTNTLKEDYKKNPDKTIQRYIRKYEIGISRELSFKEEAEHLIIAPLLGKKRAFGCIRIVNKLNKKCEVDPKGFELNDKKWLELITNLVSIAILHARRKDRDALLNDISAPSNIVELDDLFTKCAKELIRIKETYSACVIRVYDKANNNFKIKGSSLKLSTNLLTLQPGDGITDKVYFTQKKKVTHDLELIHGDHSHIKWIKSRKYNSIICLPLSNVSGTFTYGTFSVYTKFKYLFSVNDIKYLENLSNRIGNVLSEFHKNRQMKLINDLSNQINNTDSLDNIFNIVTKRIIGITNYDDCGIIRSIHHTDNYQNGEKKLVYDTFVKCTNSKLEGIELPKTFFTEQIRNHPQIYHINNVDKLGGFRKLKKKFGLRTKSIVLIPVYRDNWLYATIALLKNTVDSINTTDYELFEVLGNQIAIAIDKSEKAKKTKMLQDIVGEISQSKLNYKEDLKKIFNLISKIYRPDFASLCLIRKDSKFIQPVYATPICTDLNCNHRDCFIIKTKNRKLEYATQQLEVCKVTSLLSAKNLTEYVYNKKEAFLWPSGNKVLDNKFKSPFKSNNNQIQTEIIAPLIHVDLRNIKQVIGMITISNKRKNSYSILDKELLNIIGEQTGSIIQNKLFKQAAFILSQVRFDGLDNEEIAEKVAKTAKNILDIPVSWVRFPTLKNNVETLIIKGWAGIRLTKSDRTKLEMYEGQGSSWKVYKTAQRELKDGLIPEPKLILDITKTKNRKYLVNKYMNFYEKNGLKSMYVIPMHNGKNKVYGLLIVYTQNRAHDFFDEELIFLKDLARYASAAIEQNELNMEKEYFFNMSGPQAEINKSNKIIRVNDTYCKIFGKQREQIEGENCKQVWDCPKYGTTDCLLNKIRKTPGFYETKILRTLDDGSNVSCIVKAEPRFDESGKVISIIERYIDVKKLIEKSNLESLGMFARGMAHEINTPLATIGNFTKLLLNKELPSDDRIEYIRDIQKGISLIYDIIQNVLIFSQDNKLNTLEKVDLNEVVTKTLTLFRFLNEKDDTSVILRLADSVDYIAGDMNKLEQALINLLINAFYAVNKKAQEEKNYKKEILIKTHCSKEQVFLDVEDNGPGISDENIENIFKPFFTTKTEDNFTKKFYLSNYSSLSNMGLGLYVTYNNIFLMKGDIQVINKNNKTIFRMSFPILRRKHDHEERDDLNS